MNIQNKLMIRNFLQPKTLTKIPKREQPQKQPKNFTGNAWRSREFLVVEYKEPCGAIRISVNRTSLSQDGTTWAEVISWDDLMQIKREIGYADKCAVEVLPPDSLIVNVANMRHFFIMDEIPQFVWKHNNSIDKNISMD